MISKYLIFLLHPFLVSCLSIEMQTSTPQVRPFFITSTLPPTEIVKSTRTISPLSSATLESTIIAPAPANCRERAVLLADITIPDNTSVPRGGKFTKTWRFENTGTCPWNGFSVAFLAGDRMGGLDSIPVPITAPGAVVDISIELTAPGLDGAYAGYYELRNAKNDSLPIGIEKAFWVKILVGTAIAPLATTASPAAPLITPGGPLSCDYFLSVPYQNEIADLINSARIQAGLPALSIHSQLAAAAQDHSIDMACFGLLSHSGSDGSSIYERITAVGYPAVHYGEVIYASGYPQTAFDWWMNDAPHRDTILDAGFTEMGVGYAYNAGSFYKGYYTVDFGSR